MIKRYILLILALILIIACGCSKQTTNTSEINIQPEDFENVTITKIDLGAPENQKYVDWLDERDFGKDKYSNNKPYDWDKTRKIKGFKEKTKITHTKKWSDAWEIKLYDNRQFYKGKQELYARNKSTKEEILIDEVDNDYDGDGNYYFLVLKILDETHMIYQKNDYEGFGPIFLYTLGQDSVEIIDTRQVNEWGFTGIDDTLLYWIEWNISILSLYCTDLEKMANGDDKAIRKLFSNDASYALDETSLDFSFSIECPSSDNRYSHYLPIYLKDYYNDQKYLVVYNLITGEQLCSEKLPILENDGYFTFVWISENTQYYFENASSTYNDTHSRSYGYGDDTVEKELADVPFYEITYGVKNK